MGALEELLTTLVTVVSRQVPSHDADLLAEKLAGWVEPPSEPATTAAPVSFSTATVTSSVPSQVQAPTPTDQGAPS